MKQFRSTIILFVVVGAFALYAYFGVFKKQQLETETKDKQSVVVQTEKSRVTKIRLERGGDVTELVKDKDLWKISKPIEDFADEDAVSGFIDSLLAEKSESEINDKDLDFAVFGLDKPSHVITVEADAPVKVSLGRDAIGGKLYLRRNDEPAVLIGNALWKGYGDKGVKDLRNKSLYRLEGKSIASVTIENASGAKVRLNKKDDKWSIENSPQLDVSNTEVQNYLNQVENLKASDIAGEDKNDKGQLSKLGLSKPLVKVTLGFTDASEPYVLMVSAPNKTQEAFAVANNLKPIYKIFGTSATGFTKTSSDFRDKSKPFNFQRSDVKEIEVKTDLTQLELVNKDGKWALKSDDPAKEVDQTTVDSFINQVHSLKVKDFVSDKSIAAKKKLVLKDQAGKALIELGWNDPIKDKNEYKVKSSLSDEIVTLEGPALNSLPIQTLVKNKQAQASLPPEATGSQTDTHRAGEKTGH